MQAYSQHGVITESCSPEHLKVVVNQGGEYCKSSFVSRRVYRHHLCSVCSVVVYAVTAPGGMAVFGAILLHHHHTNREFSLCVCCRFQSGDNVNKR